LQISNYFGIENISEKISTSYPAILLKLPKVAIKKFQVDEFVDLDWRN